MALVSPLVCKIHQNPSFPRNPNFKKINHSSQFPVEKRPSFSFPTGEWKLRRRFSVCNKLQEDHSQSGVDDDEAYSVGVKAALLMLSFYKREISPLLPKSCRYVPTCSEYSTIAYKRYGAVKGTALTVCRICRCNPLGGSGFDPPRWFDEPIPPEP